MLTLSIRCHAGCSPLLWERFCLFHSSYQQVHFLLYVWLPVTIHQTYYSLIYPSNRQRRSCSVRRSQRLLALAGPARCRFRWLCGWPGEDLEWVERVRRLRYGIAFADKGLHHSMGNVLKWRLQGGCIVNSWWWIKQVAKIRLWWVILLVFSSRIYVDLNLTGCDEMLFNPLVQWWRKGPIAHQIHKFIWSGSPLHYKFSMMAYMFSYCKCTLFLF